MFIYSLKLNKGTVLTAVLASAVIALTLILLPMGGRAVGTMLSVGKAPKCSSGEERVEWLQSLGWQVEEQSETAIAVTIPQEFDEIYSQYAIMQRKGGFRLERHKGKTATKYCYAITNYGNGSEAAVASILQRGDRVIAADLSSARLGGFLKPLAARTDTKMK